MKRILVADLFCGAGGSSTGAERALARLGLQMELVCVNHWGTALETHQRNHPRARHYCADISQVRPHQVVPEGYLDLLMASPTCTHHSIARGGKPTSDQQRSDPWHVITWLTELRVKRMLIENVWEYVKWGPVDPETRRPIKEREGEYFRAWIETIRSLGATSIEWRKLNSADVGGATTRQRFFGFFRFDDRRLVLPVSTHVRRDRVDVEGLKPWRPAREIIDWSVKGRSIFRRKAPLAPKTLARILAGAIKFGWPQELIVMLVAELERALIYALRFAFASRHIARADLRARNRRRVRQYAGWLRHVRTGEVRSSHGLTAPMLITLRNNVVARALSSPVPTLAARGQHICLAEPIIIKQNFRRDLQSVDDPAPTATTVARIGLVEPFVLSRHGEGAPRAVDEPTPTQVAKHSHVLISPYYGSGSGETLRCADEPLPTATAKARFGMVVPITHSDISNRARDVEVDPLSTVTTAKRGELAFIAAQFGEREGQAPRVHDLAQPLPAVCASGHVNLVEAEGRYDVLFRMLLPHELAAAMGFGRDYHFAGTKTEQIKQIGNAVSVEQMEANVYAIMQDEASEPEFLEAAE